jgi:hypothetical protein
MDIMRAITISLTLAGGRFPPPPVIRPARDDNVLRAHFRTWQAANFAFNWSDTIPRYRFVGPDRSAGLEHTHPTQ